MKLSKKHLIGLIGLLVAPALSFAAPSLLPIDAIVSTDTTKVKKGWWTVGAEVANNSSFFGRNTAVRFPYAAASLTYLHRTGLWASVTSYKLFDTAGYVDETDLSVGYATKISDLVEVNLSYSRFIFGENTPLVKAATSNATSAKAALDWGILYTGFTTSYIFGESHDIFTVLENSRFIPLNPLWNGKHVIGLDPKVSVTAGTQRFYETHTTTTGGGSTGGKPGKGKLLPGVLAPPGSGSTTTTTTEVVSKFKVLNYELKLPVVMYWGNFELEPAYRYSIPVNKIEGDNSEAQSFYSFNISYTF
ncbi:hypothetical protein [Pontibacter arcticus]|uniref:Uncharacterized protein n=1 Tax=Pontibacter arcticus TaxID=2080288 RepID=A0A364RCS9_9BACT|nr:hypothetical protein [Pontibacter arcticus]RAU81956.1 hypothetical protein DP923_14845 [Pontibacter arcticus]